MADLQQKVTSVTLEKDSLARENVEITKLLSQNHFDDSMAHESHGNFALDKSLQTAFHHEGAVVSRRHSSDAETGRVAVAPVQPHWTYRDRNPVSVVVTNTADHASRDGRDTWDAVDFILTLETPCRDHVNLPTHLSDRSGHAAADHDEPSNHSLTMTAAVYACTVQLSDHRHGITGGDATTYGFVPHFELERLLDFSRGLELDDQYMTPIQIYASLKQQADSAEQLSAMLRRFSGPMVCHVECFGFGAVMLAEKFHEVISHAELK